MTLGANGHTQGLVPPRSPGRGSSRSSRSTPRPKRRIRRRTVTSRCSSARTNRSAPKRTESSPRCAPFRGPCRRSCGGRIPRFPASALAAEAALLVAAERQALGDIAGKPLTVTVPASSTCATRCTRRVAREWTYAASPKGLSFAPRRPRPRPRSGASPAPDRTPRCARGHCRGRRLRTVSGRRSSPSRARLRVVVRRTAGARRHAALVRRRRGSDARRGFAHHRPDEHARIEWVADRERLDDARHLRGELVVHVVVHVEPGRECAALPAQQADAQQRRHRRRRRRGRRRETRCWPTCRRAPARAA